MQIPVLSALLALALASAADPVTPSFSWTEADALRGKLRAVEAAQRTSPRPRLGSILVRESELNSYLNLPPGKNVPRGVTDVTVSLQRERIEARGMIDLDDVKTKIKGLSPWNPLSFLAGRVPVEIRGRLSTSDGFGTVSIDDVYVASVPIPISMLQQMVLSSTKNARYPEGFDITAPFRLPYSVRRVRLDRGQAFLDF
jgi:hypothetical protein